ncbi:MAG: HAMP domain-containing histidine kinase [Natronospirillum sp.]
MTKLSRTPLSRGLTIALVLVCGFLVTSIAAWQAHVASFKLWETASVADAERLSAELRYRVLREREPLIAAATLYYGSEEVTQTELEEAQTLLSQAATRDSELSIAFVQKNSDGHYEAQQASGNVSLLPTGQFYRVNGQLAAALEQAQAASPELIIGNLFEQDGTSYLSMAMAAPNAGELGILIVLINFSQLVGEVTQNLLTHGRTVEITHPLSGSYNHSNTLPLLSSAESRHAMAINMGLYDWELLWLFDADGALDRTLYYTVWGFGLIITLLLAQAFHNLLRQQYRIQQQVEEKTEALKQTFRSLQKTQQRMVQQEKMASLGSLVAGVSHELNTPIGNGLMAASILQDRAVDMRKSLDSGELRRSELEDYLITCDDTARIIQQNVKRAAALINSFKEVAVDQTSERRRQFNLATVINEVLSSLQPQLKKTQHQFELRVPDNIEMDSFPGPLGQVITNLILNSLVHGFEDGQAGTMLIHVRLEGTDSVELTYKDNGVGISEAIRSKVFDPFFTTRMGSGGSGLGLHIVYNIVHGMLGGDITLEPAERGALFVITMPTSAPTSRQQEQSA